MGEDLAISGPPGPIQVAVANDYVVVVDGLAALLAPFGDEVAVADRLIVGERVDRRVDVALYDVFGQPAIEGPVRWLSEQPEVGRVAVLASAVTTDLVDRAEGAGASGVLSTSLPVRELIAAIRRVAAGEPVRVLGPAQGAGRSERDWPGRSAGLSERESEVCALATGGMTNGEIAGVLCIGRETVKTHLSSVYRKLGTRNRVQVAAWVAREAGFRRCPAATR